MAQKNTLIYKSTSFLLLEIEDCNMILFVLTHFLKQHDLSYLRHHRYYRDLYKNHQPQF